MREEEEKKRNESGQSLKKKHWEELIDKSLEETFPASDPPAHVRIEGELQKDRLGNTKATPEQRTTETKKMQNRNTERSADAPMSVSEQQTEDMIDEASDETFPASDPPASHHVEGEIKPDQVEENKNKTAEPRKPEKTDKKEMKRQKEKERAGH